MLEMDWFDMFMAIQREAGRDVEAPIGNASIWSRLAILKYAGSDNGGVTKDGKSGGHDGRDESSEGTKGGSGGGELDVGGEGAAAAQISTLAASISFPEDLFDDHRVSAMYRSLFGFAPVSRR